MKRHITLATMATLSLASLPAFADHAEPDIYRMPRPVVTSYSPAFGPAGTSVTISGDNFVDGMKVVFGDVLITPTFVSDDVLAFTIPVGAADASISIDMPGSRRNLAVGSFDVRLPSYRHDDDLGYGYGYGRGNGKDHGYRNGKGWSRSSIRSRYNRGFLRLPAVRSELALHAERTARLNRMLRLSLGKPRMTYRIQIALQREDRRHNRTMAALKAEWGRVRYIGSSS